MNTIPSINSTEEVKYSIEFPKKPVAKYSQKTGKLFFLVCKVKKTTSV